MNKLPSIDYREKYYWTAKKPVLINNMLLAEDWNQFEAIDTCVEIILTLSSVLTTVFGDPIDISGYLILKTKEKYPSTSFLSTINGSTLDRASGISTIKINDDILYGLFDVYYLSSDAKIVNTLNGKNGHLYPILTGISINGVPESFSTIMDLGYFFKLNQAMVSSINNDLRGQQWVITSIVINDRTYSSIDSQYNLLLDENFGDNLFKKTETLVSATILMGDNNNSIVNLLTFKPYLKLSATLPANTLCTFYNVFDWISITNNDYIVIEPTLATLLDDVLTIKSPSAGIIYYISKITT